MTTTKLAAIERPINRSSAVPKRITPRLRRALTLMAHSGLRDNDAAAQAGMTVDAIRLALKQPHVRSWYRQQCEVFRESLRGRAYFRAAEIMDAADNLPALNAARLFIEDAEERSAANGLARSPGVVVVIRGDAQISSGPAADMTEKGSASD